MPVGFGNIEQQLLIWLLAMIRPSAAFLAAPVFGAPSVPVQVRVVIALGIGIPAAAASSINIMPNEVLTFGGLMMVVSEIILGLSIGFAIQISFSAAMLAGELISNTMGLGFAAMMNPMSGQHGSAVGQFLWMLATFLFLSMDGHTALGAIIVESYTALPMGQSWLSFKSIDGLVQFGGLMFAAGLTIALPVGFALILVQIILAMITRSTPTLNLFSVGMPATLLAGIVLLAIATPAIADSLESALNLSLDQANTLTKG